METRRVKIEIGILKFYQSFHILLIFLIILCHIISVNKYLMIYKSFIIIFIISMCIYLLNFIFLSISTVLMFTKKKSPTLFNIFKNITFKIMIFSLIKGIILTILFWLNYYYFPKFIQDCPFNFSSDSLIKLINKNQNQNQEYSKECSMKRCIFQNISDEDTINKFIYLCNFDAEYSIYNKNDSIKCKYATSNDYLDKKIFFYLDKCNRYNFYYECSTKEKKHDKYFVKYNQKCPSQFKKKRYVALGILFPFIDVIADITIWLFIYYQYILIIKYLNFDYLAFLTRFTPSSLNSTKDSSIINHDNNNRDIITQININQNALIIYPPLNNNNSRNNKIKNKENKIDSKIDKDNNSLFESKCDLISDNSITNRSINTSK